MKQQVLNQLKADSIYSELAYHIKGKIRGFLYLQESYTPKEIINIYLSYLEKMGFDYKVIYKNKKSNIPVRIKIIKHTLGSKNYDCVFCSKVLKYEPFMKRRDDYYGMS